MATAANAKLISALIDAVKPPSGRAHEGNDEDLWESGRLDSFAVINLVFKIEETFDLVFRYPDLNAKNFKSVNAILQMLADKYGVALSSTE